MLDVEAFILVGGQSSRMGSDKSRLLFDGHTSVELIAAAVGAISSEVRLVGSTASADPVYESIPDSHQRWGALGGIHAALGACQLDWALIVACDLPLVSADLFIRLARLGDEGSFDTVIPVQSDGRPQPLCGLYRRNRSLPEVNRLIAAGEHMPRRLLANLNTRWIAFDEISDLDDAEYLLYNVNTPADYERAQQLIRDRIAAS